MLSLGSREGRHRIEQGFSSCNNRREIEIGDVELEEGEACSYHDDDDPTIDPDVALSYIGEKLQNVLGHFQKDFEGLVSADSLGPKNGEYGTFLPAYRRSPGSHSKSSPNVQNRPTPQPPSTLPPEGRNHISLATMHVSHSAKRGSAASHPASSSAYSPLTPNIRAVQIPKAQSIQEGLAPKPVNRDQRTLKVRIKVGSDNLSMKKNTAIYSGLGLDGSPSSSFDDSLKGSHRLPRRQAYDSFESPTQILEMMTSFPLFGGSVLSPLADDLLHISENPQCMPDILVRPSSKITQRPSYSVKDNKDVSGENTVGLLDKEGIFMQTKAESNDRRRGVEFPLKDSDVDVASCDELITSALKLHLLSDSYGNKKEDIPKTVTAKSNGVIKAERTIIYANEKMTHLDNPIQLRNLGKQVSGKGTSSSGSRKKTKKGGARGSTTGKVVVESDKDMLRYRKTTDSKLPSFKNEGENVSPEKNVKKMKETYSDFFGNLSDHEGDVMNSPVILSKQTLKTSDLVEKATLVYDNISREKASSVLARGDTSSEMKNSSKSRRKIASGVPISGPSENVLVAENGQPTSDQASVGPDSDVWAECDKCSTWRLLPPGTKENELPDKWRCSLQTWLPNLNHCGISYEEAIRAVRARYNLIPEIPNNLDVSLDKLASGTIAVDKVHPIVSNDGKLKKTSKTPFQDNLNGPSCSLKLKEQSSKARAFGKFKDNRLTNAQQTKPGEMSLETNKRKTSKQLQPDCHSDGGNLMSPKIKGERESNQEVPETSKRSKTRGSQSGDGNRVTSLIQGTEIVTGSMNVSKSDNGDVAPKKRKRDSFKDLPNSTPSLGKGLNDNEQSRNKRHRMSKSEAKEASTSKRNGKADRKSKSISQHITDNNEPLRKDSSSANVAATSSSSKATISLKVKYKFQEMKGSPVESVSSSPLRSSIPDKLASGFGGTVEKFDVQEKTGKVVRHQNGNGRCVDERSEGEGKMEPKMSESYVNMPDNMEVCKERKKNDKNRVQDSFDCNVNIFRQENVQNQEISVPDCKGQQGNSEQRDSKMFDAEKAEPLKLVSMKEKSQCLPPSNGVKNEISNTALGNNASVSCTDIHAKGSQLNKNTDSQDGIPHGLSKQSISNGNKIQIKETPSPHKRDSVSQAASTAIKEAKGLKHLADRVKNADPKESTGLYFEAALKFLHGASLLESGKTESAKQGDIVQAMQIYSDTAKLCRFCAHEYEKFKDMATAALAYKCMEVAYMRVVYLSHNIASRDRSELQTVLKMVPPGESPSSSASDIDNLNNTAIGDKAAHARSVDSPLPAGNLVIAARNRPNFSRLLSFAQDVNSAMEASRKSHIAFGAASASMGHSNTMDVITSIQRALDLNFHDVDGLLRLVRLAKEAISR